MSIRCQLCNREFPKIIPYQHLQKEHNLTGKQYSEHYGSTISDETRLKQQARIPHNKGKKITDPAVLEQHRRRIALREEKYQSGLLVRSSKPASDLTKQRISEGVKAYAKTHHAELSVRAGKAIATKKSKGTVISGMKGKKHTRETKEKIIASTQQYRDQSKILTIENRKQLLEKFDITVIAISRSQVICECNHCKFQFTRTFTNSNEQKLTQIVNKICPKCREKSPLHSRAELEISQWIRNNTTCKVRLGDRSVITPLELDIYIPEKKLAIEYCGLYWHSELSGSKHSSYHQVKWQKCKDLGIKLITIFEDEWINTPDIVLSMLSRNLDINATRIAARRCQVIDLTTNQARDFFDKNHIHGYANSKIKLGLTYDNQLIYAMTFAKKNISRKNSEWEIQRMAGTSNVIVQGGASKLFAEFCRRENPQEVISYADLRWFTGDSYEKMGFSLQNYTVPGYWYFSLPNYNRIHRFTMRKNINDNSELTEWQNRQAQGWDRIWDCGHAKWVWKKMTGQD